MNRREWVFAMIVLVAAVAVILVTLGTSTNPQYPRTVSTTSTTAPFTTSIVASNGLVLSLVAKETIVPYGSYGPVDIDLVNRLGSQNRVLLGDNWPAQNLSLSPCGRAGRPYGVAIYAGVYGRANLSLGQAIHIFTWPPNANSSAPDCPNPYYATPLYFIFQPDSDIAIVHYQSGQNATLGMGFTLLVGNIGGIGPGTYTLICGDSWGDLILIHFTLLPPLKF
jgi:hypothetical protein